LRSFAIASFCFCSSASYNRDRSTFIAFALFFTWDFSSCCETTMPVGMCVMRTAE